MKQFLAEFLGLGQIVKYFIVSQVKTMIKKVLC